MAEELAFDQLFRDGSRVHRHEGSIGAPGTQVDLARDELLASSVLPRDQDPALRRSRDRDLFLQDSHDLAVADDLRGLENGPAQLAILQGQARSLERVIDTEQELVVGEGLLQKVVGTELGGAHGRLDGAVSGHHHHRQPGEPLA